MKALVFVLFFLLSTLFAQESVHGNNFYTTAENNETVKIQEQPKVLYLNYEKIPKRLVAGEIFPVTIKTLSTIQDIDDINYTFSDMRGLTLINPLPTREISGRYYHDTFYFIAEGVNAQLPTFTASIVKNSQIPYRETSLEGEKLNVIALNPQNDFSDIIADSFTLSEYKTTSYDNRYNIVIFIAEAHNCNIAALHLNDVYKQGIESINESIKDSKITYYAIINKEKESLSFSYFNLLTNKFEAVHIPIVVSDDSVTTQTDLKPRDQSKEMLKATIVAIISLLLIIFIVLKRRYIYLLVMLFPLAYILYVIVPSKEVCIKQGTNIHLLPVKNGTIFETTTQIMHLQIEGSIKGYTKVKLPNEKIGWIENEDICSR